MTTVAATFPSTPAQPMPDNANPTADANPAAVGRKCVTLIFNPVSGQGDPEARKRAISDALSQHGYGCQELITTKEKGARAFAQEALESGVDLLAVSGGDGTVVEVMSALVGTNVPLAIFPAGTGNLLSLNLGLPMTVPDAVHAALFGDKRSIDLARLTLGDTQKDPGQEKYFAIIAGAGFDAGMIKDADREAKNKLGKGAYLFAALKNIKRRPMKARIHIDDEPLALVRRAKSVMVANMGRLQGNVEMIPDAKPDDGYLDIAVLKAETMGQWMRLLWSTLTRRLKDDPAIEYHQAKKVTVILSKPHPMQFDGEEEDPHTTFTVEIVPGAVSVMVPKASPV